MPLYFLSYFHMCKRDVIYVDKGDGLDMWDNVRLSPIAHDACAVAHVR